MNAPGQPGAELWLLILLIAFPIVWCSIVAGISRISGWHALAKSYRAEETTFRIAEVDGSQRFRWASMTTGPSCFPTNYSNCLTLSVGPEGIGLKAWPMFRFGHPPLLIPWSAITHCKLDKYWMVTCRATVDLHSPCHPLRFYGGAAQAIDRMFAARVASKSKAAPVAE